MTHSTALTASESTIKAAVAATDASTTTATDTERRLIALIESELVLPAQTVHAATPIANLGDSLDWLELLMAVDDAFDVQLDPAHTKSVRTVADLLRLLPQAGDGLKEDLQASTQRSRGTRSARQPF